MDTFTFMMYSNMIKINHVVDDMKRVAGSLLDKKKMLSSLDSTVFPYLVADILSYIHNHQEIKVMDGPGDGRRDIHSIFPNGEKGITQCKFHTSDTNVSSRETDEIVISLNKFGVKNGIFATTGGVSPQSKREYLDNYPGFSLKLWDADEVINSILSNHVLRSYWVNGESIINSTRKIYLPFTIRSSDKDKPLVREIQDILMNSSSEFNFTTYSGDQTLFYPYRPPQSADVNEDGGLKLTCWMAEINSSLFELQDKIDELIFFLSSKLSHGTKIQLRMGFPCASNGDDIHEITKILKYKPATFILDNGISTTEQDYILPNDISWCFPDNLSVLESPWACWFNRTFETFLTIELEQDRQDKPSHFESEKLKWDRMNLDMSLFIGGSKENVNSFLSNIDENTQPNHTINFGYDGKIMFWEHPNITYQERFGLQYSIDKSGGMVVNQNNLHDVVKFNAIKAKLLKKSNKFNLNKSNAEEYEAAYKLLYKRELLETPSKRRFHSAELFHFFEDCASPIKLSQGIITFTKFFSCSLSLDVVRDILVEVSSSISDHIHLEANMLGKLSSPFIKLDIHYINTMSESILSIINNNQIYNKMSDIENSLRQKIDTLTPSTSQYLRDGIGFKLTDNKFEGNPFVIRNGIKSDWNDFEKNINIE